MVLKGFAVVMSLGVLLLALAARHLPGLFGWTVTLVYGAGLVAVSFSSIFFRMRVLPGQPVAKMQFEAARAISDNRLGWARHISKPITEILAFTTWPAVILMAIYLNLLKKKAQNPMAVQLYGAALVPAWLNPAMLTFVALGVISLRPSGGVDYPIKLVALSFVGSTLLILLLQVVVGGVKDQVLGRAGYPRLNFALLFAAMSGAAAMSRIFIDQWAHLPATGFLQSFAAILNFSDVRALAEPRHLTFAELAQNPGRVASLKDITVAEGSKALIALLFYFGLFRLALDILSARREPRHHVAIGASAGALGHFEDAEKHLSEAKELLDAQTLLAGVRLRMGDYEGLVRATRRACGIADIGWSAEEEAVIALVSTTMLLPLSGDALVRYLAHRRGDFADPALTTMLVRGVLPLAMDLESASDQLEALLETDPWAGIWRSDIEGDTVEVRSRLAALHPTAFGEKLLHLELALSSSLDDDVGTSVDGALLSIIESDIDALKGLAGSVAHWQGIIGHISLARSQGIYRIRTGTAHPGLTSLQERMRAQVENSDIFGRAVKVLGKLETREMDAFVERMRAPSEAQDAGLRLDKQSTTI